ncbi:hypothetical protein [uncultured Rhodoblastus sp.]|uniref:lipopolysaccharide biosynthesis protein n=1 Tax=uncultured Rhodoblastus sp. TaxID=543037 RepID=UPI0025F6B26C|nr:hypothetical protein [uncultured Rhodoblastus sp.]
MTSVVLARSLNADGRGVLLACTFYPMFFAALFNLSLNEATAVQLSRILVNDSGARAVRYEITSLSLQTLIAVLGTALSLLLVHLVWPEDQHEHLRAVEVFAASFTPISMLDLHFKAILQARGAYERLSVLRLCQPIAYAALLITLVATSQIQIEIVMAAQVFALMFSLICGISLAGVVLAPLSLRAASENLFVGLKFHAANLLLYTSAEIDKPIVLMWLDSSSAGAYVVALTISTLGVAFVGQSMAVLLVRNIAQAAALSEQRAIFYKQLSFTAALLALVNGVAAYMAPWLIPLAFGESFRSAVPVLQVLLLMGVFKGIRQIADRAMRVMHNVRVGMSGELVALAGMLTFSLIGVKFGGLIGLAWGNVLAQFCSLVVVLVTSGKVLSTDGSILLMTVGQRLRNVSARCLKLKRSE